MAAGLRDLLALQGVVPVSAPVVVTVPGLTLNQLSGVWVSGAAPVSIAPGFLSWMQISGVWVNGSTQEFIEPVLQPGGSSNLFAQARREDEEILTIIHVLAMKLM